METVSPRHNGVWNGEKDYLDQLDSDNLEIVSKLQKDGEPSTYVIFVCALQIDDSVEELPKECEDASVLIQRLHTRKET